MRIALSVLLTAFVVFAVACSGKEVRPEAGAEDVVRFAERTGRLVGAAEQCDAYFAKEVEDCAMQAIRDWDADAEKKEAAERTFVQTKTVGADQLRNNPAITCSKVQSDLEEMPFYRECKARD